MPKRKTKPKKYEGPLPSLNGLKFDAVMKAALETPQPPKEKIKKK